MPFGPYVRFARANARLVGFGFLMAFASSYGQTYFVGIFGPSIRESFGLSQTGWGTIYMVGTLVSAAVLPWTGKQIDRLDLRLYAALVLGLLALACLVAAATQTAWMLVLTVFLLRQSGQGLSSHTAITTMARYFDVGRGRAIAIASLGFSFGESIWPILAVFVIAALGWRVSYAGSGAMVALALLPTALWLLKGHGERHRAHLARTFGTGGETQAVLSWTRGEMLRDARFWLLLPGLYAPSLILTAMFFHNLDVAEAKGWSATWITGNYVVYAAVGIATSLAAGPLIDRFGARRLVPPMLVPLALSLLAVAWGRDPLWVWPYLALAGINSGIGFTAVAALWPELYGTRHLGAIKSLASALGVFASALGPVIMGGLMDLGYSTDLICYLFAGSTLIGTVTMTMALTERRRPRTTTAI
jgi:MFS family permease